MTMDSTTSDGLSSAQSDGSGENLPQTQADGPGAVQLAQANGAPSIPMPGPGERVTIQFDGQPLNFAFPFDPEDVVAVGGNAEITAPNGGVVVIEGLMDAIVAGMPVVFFGPDGQPLNTVDYLVALGVPLEQAVAAAAG
ncbi:MAG: hypothetical protein WEB85_15480, partial [Dongiaceae bacterium]